MQPIGLNYDNVIDFSGDRITVMDHPVALPGKCIVCGYPGGDNRRRFIDFGLSIDFYGSVNFCSLCLSEIARKLGFVHQEEFDRLRLEKSELLATIDDLRDVSDIKRDLANFGAALSKKFGLLEEVERRNVSHSSSGESKSERAKPKPAESSSKRGSSVVRDDAKPKSRTLEF